MAINEKQMDSVKKTLKKEMQLMFNNCELIDAAVAVTTDGLMLEKIERVGFPLKRVATMGSSLMALGDTITAELNMGSCRNIISENQHGILAFMHINSDIVLVTLTQKTTGLGMLLSASRICCERVRKEVNI